MHPVWTTKTNDPTQNITSKANSKYVTNDDV